MLGYITSGRYHGSPCGSSSYGFCDARLTYDMQQHAAEMILQYAESDTINNETNTDIHHSSNINSNDQNINKNNNQKGKFESSKNESRSDDIGSQSKVGPKNPRGGVLSLVMFRSPRSLWLRPGLIDIVSVTK